MLRKASVVIPDIFVGFAEPLREVLKAHDYVLREFHTDTGLSRMDLDEAIADAEILVICVDRITQEVLESARSLRLLVKLGAGLDNIDLQAATEKRIPVLYTPGANATSVAELSVGLMFSLARHIPLQDRRAKLGEWRLQLGVQLRGKTLGVIGLGRIGQEVATICKAIGMKVIATDPEWPSEFADFHQIVRVSLHDLLKESDFVSVHVPLSSSTERLIGHHEFKLMKRSAFLINTSRGRVVDEDALYECLRSGAIAGAAMDTFAEEPPRTRRLLLLDNFIATSHIGGSTDGAITAVIAAAKEGITDLIRGEKPKSLANPACWDIWFREEWPKLAQR